MAIPSAFTTVLLAALASLILGAVWLLTFRAAGKVRFELFALDFGMGAFVAAMATGLTLGTFGTDIAFYDNLNIMRKSSVLFLFGFGMLTCLGLWLFLGAASVAGTATVFVTGASMAVLVSSLGTHMVRPMTSGLYVAISAVLLTAAVALGARAQIERLRQRDLDLLQKAAAAGVKGKVARSSPAKGLILAVASGIALGLMPPSVEWVQLRDEIAFGAYCITVLVGVAFLIGGPFIALFFLNLPVQGEALPFGAWLKLQPKQHLMGVLGGMLWFAALVGLYIACANPRAEMARNLAFAVSRGSLVLGAAIGIFVQGDYSISSSARMAGLIGLLAAMAALVVLAAAPAIA